MADSTFSAALIDRRTSICKQSRCSANCIECAVHRFRICRKELLDGGQRMQKLLWLGPRPYVSAISRVNGTIS